MQRAARIPIVLFLLAGPAAAADLLVQAQLAVDGEVVGTPSVQVSENTRASVEVAGADAQSGYRWTVIAQRSQRDRRRSFTLQNQLYRRAEGRWELLGTPIVEVLPGKQSTVSLQDANGAPRYSLALTVVDAPE